MTFDNQMSSILSKTNSIVEKIKHGCEVFCDQCGMWIHISCNNTSKEEYESFQNESDNIQWICLKCTIINNSSLFPFTLESDEVLLRINVINLPSLADTLPSFEISSSLTTLPNLSDYDTDENLNVNSSSQYSTVEGIASKAVPDTALSLFHMNIGSLSLHFDELHTLLSCLNVNFQVIGLSETKSTNGSHVKVRMDLPGYMSYETHSLSCAGGVRIYVYSNLTANRRDDLCISNN